MAEMLDVQHVERSLGIRLRRREYWYYAMLNRGTTGEAPPVHLTQKLLAYRGDKVADLVVGDFLADNHAKDFENFTLWRSTAAKNDAYAQALKDTNVLAALASPPKSVSRQDIHHLGTIFEALIGAVYFDGDIAHARMLLDWHFLPRVRTIIKDVWSSNPVLQLAQVCQKTIGVNPKFTRVESPRGTYRIKLVIKGRLTEYGEGSNFTEAKNAAALQALRKLQAGTLG